VDFRATSRRHRRLVDLSFTLSGVQLGEVTIDQTGSTPVLGGDCYYQVPNTIFTSGFESKAL